MALFGEKKSKEEKQAEELQKFMSRYGLEDLSAQDLDTVKRIANDLIANGLFKAGLALSMANAAEQAKVTYLSALVEQNWLIVNQLTRLNRSIEKLESK